MFDRYSAEHVADGRLVVTKTTLAVWLDRLTLCLVAVFSVLWFRMPVTALIESFSKGRPELSLVFFVGFGIAVLLLVVTSMFRWNMSWFPVSFSFDRDQDVVLKNARPLCRLTNINRVEIGSLRIPLANKYLWIRLLDQKRHPIDMAGLFSGYLPSIADEIASYAQVPTARVGPPPFGF